MTSVDHLLRDHPAGSTSRQDHLVEWVKNVERHQPWWQTGRPDPEQRLKVLLDMDYSIHFYVFIFMLRKGIAPIPVSAAAVPGDWSTGAAGGGAGGALVHPLGAPQAVRDAVGAVRVAASTVRGAGVRRLRRLDDRR